jgi:Cu(I)/Ag(I) efflux system protein CusF
MTVITKKLILSVSAVFAISLGAAQAQTQSHEDHVKSGVHGEVTSWTTGEIKKVDVSQKKITIKHEDIKNLQMPGMTMVFNVKNIKLIERLSTGDSVKFVAAQEGERYFVTDIKPNR